LGFKDLIVETEVVLNRVCSFLGVQELDWSKKEMEAKNTREYVEPILEDDRLFLEDFYSEPNRQLIERIGPVNW
jgi:hypothetical protein